MNEWVSVLVEMPDSDLLVLIYEKDQDPDVFLGYHDGECWRDSDATPCKVSHWMPLPKPPTT